MALNNCKFCNRHFSSTANPKEEKWGQEKDFSFLERVC